MNIYDNDQPIDGSEGKPDLLNRRKFAEYLTDILVIDPKDECYTVSLEGEWGDGKTSTVNLIKESIEKKYGNKRHKPVIIEYNPWLAGKDETLIQDFLIHFSSQLNMLDKSTQGQKIAKELISYSSLFNTLKLIPGVEPWASIVQGVMKTVGETTKKVSDLKELNLKQKKERLSNLIEDFKKPIIVILDDIDRVTPREAFQILRLVKAVADFAGTSYLLCYDPEYLISVLSNNNIEKPSLYIDKVVQLRIPLPILTFEDKNSIVDKELERLGYSEIINHYEGDNDRMVSVYNIQVKFLINNIRELKRIFNNLRFVYSQIKNEVCFTDLFCLSVLVIKAPAIYKAIKEQPEIFIGQSFVENYTFKGAYDVVNENKEKFDELLKEYSEFERTLLTGILEEIFPLLKDNRTHGINYDKAGRVTSKKRLYTALHYQLPKGFVSDMDVRKFINCEIPLNEFIKQMINEESVDRFFEMLLNNIESIESKNALKILMAMYESLLFEKYVTSQYAGTRSFISRSTHQEIISISKHLISKNQQKTSLLKAILKEEKYLPVSSTIIRILLIQNNELNDRTNYKDEKWLKKSDYKKIKNEWAELACEAIQKDEYFKSVYSTQIFYSLFHVDVKSLKKLFGEWIKNDKGIEQIAYLTGRSGYDSTNGAYTQFDEETMAQLVDIKLFESKVKKILDSKNNLNNYLSAVYKSIITRKSMYLDNTKRR